MTCHCKQSLLILHNHAKLQIITATFKTPVIVSLSIRNDVSKWQVHLGKHTISLKLGDGEKIAKIKKIIKHKDFDPKTMRQDLAVLVLDRSIPVDGQQINVVCLDQDEDMTAKTHCFVTGWGVTESKTIFLSNWTVLIRKKNLNKELAAYQYDLKTILFTNWDLAIDPSIN